MKVFWLITLAVCFGYIRNMFPKVVKAAKDSYGECYFKDRFTTQVQQNLQKIKK